MLKKKRKIAPASLANLTRTGKGQPKKGLKRVQITLSPELLERIAQLQEQQEWDRNYAIEQAMRAILGMASDYDLGDFEMIAKSGRCLE